MKWLPDRARPRFALGRALVGGALVLNERRRGLLHALALPLAVHLAWRVFEAAAPARAAGLVYGMLVLSIVLYVLMAVNIHRLVLLGAGAVPPLGLGGWGLREWRYSGWWWLQWIAASFAFLMLAPLTQLGAAGMVVAVLGASWVAGRMTMVLPGIAIDRPLGLRSAWRLGQGAGFRLAVLTVGVPVAGALLLIPLSQASLLPVRIFSTVLSDLVVAWAVAATSLAWLALGERTGEAGATPAPPPAVTVIPDASTGVLVVTCRGRFAAADLGHLAENEGLVAYHGRLRGIVVVLEGQDWDPGEGGANDWTALDTLLAHLPLVRVHQQHIRRVALLGPTVWAVHAENLVKHFPQGTARYFPPIRLDRARAWAAGEES
ncbi:MAG TPA: STAS/SEC14 domain-containing protein [Pseudomonadales bacterium]|nr:STAS/SEC14 domain-containing protein [Pseudomonadales bacterium]